jgi:hypothetical protein
MLFGLFDSAHTFQLGGQLYVVKKIYQSSDVMFSKQMTDPPLPLPLEMPYLQYPSSVRKTPLQKVKGSKPLTQKL